jgi:hypothetical protein
MPLPEETCRLPDCARLAEVQFVAFTLAAVVRLYLERHARQGRCWCPVCVQAEAALAGARKASHG